MSKKSTKLFLPSKEKLDQTVLDIEFLLISVVQGVALAALASAAVQPLSNGQWEYIPYVLSAFLIILIFWSQAIIHTLSFIDWPLDITHNFFYFLVSFVEVMAFNHLTNPLKWFEFMTAFFIVATLLYFVDLSLIVKHKEKYNSTPNHKLLYKHIYSQQTFELKTLISTALIFNALAVYALYSYPDFFLKQHGHVFLIGVQLIITVIVLLNSLKSFRKRISLISNLST